MKSLKHLKSTLEITKQKAFFVNPLAKNPNPFDIVCTVVWVGEENLPNNGKETCSICLSDTPANRKLAERYKKAVEAGVIYKNPVIKTGVKNHQYIESEGFVMAKYLNSDLKKLGF